MNDFREALSRFRYAIHREGELSESPGLRAILEGERPGKGLWLQWAAAAVVLVLALSAIPAYENAQRQREADQVKADTVLLEQVNAGLSRSVPRAMAPLVDWAPGN